MLGGGGYYRGSTILISGTAGTGKSSLCAHFADAVCKRGVRCLYTSYEESPKQLQRNMASIGLDLASWEQQGLLRFQALRATSHGLEGHLALLHKQLNELDPHVVILEPVGTLLFAGAAEEAVLMLVRVIDALKARGITAMLSNLTDAGGALEQTMVGVSSVADTWLLLKSIESAGERNRCLYVLKSRGMAHSNQIGEFLITPTGVDLVEPYIGPEGVLIGSARRAQELRERLAMEAQESELDRRAKALEHKRVALEQQIAALRAEFATEKADVMALLEVGKASKAAWAAERERAVHARGAQDVDLVRRSQRMNGERKQRVQRA